MCWLHVIRYSYSYFCQSRIGYKQKSLIFICIATDVRLAPCDYRHRPLLGQYRFPIFSNEYILENVGEPFRFLYECLTDILSSTI